MPVAPQARRRMDRRRPRLVQSAQPCHRRHGARITGASLIRSGTTFWRGWLCPITCMSFSIRRADGRSRRSWRHGRSLQREKSANIDGTAVLSLALPFGTANIGTGISVTKPTSTKRLNIFISIQLRPVWSLLRRTGPGAAPTPERQSPNWRTPTFPSPF